MASSRSIVAIKPPRVVSRHWTFFCGMLAFLMLPFTPVQFTSILTAVVWTFSGVQYAVVFAIFGSFSLESIPIYNGIKNIIEVFLPATSGMPLLVGAAVVAVMLLGNLATAFFFKWALGNKLSQRLQSTSSYGDHL